MRTRRCLALLGVLLVVVLDGCQPGPTLPEPPKPEPKAARAATPPFPKSIEMH